MRRVAAVKEMAALTVRRDRVETALRLRLLSGEQKVQWRAIAKDGADLVPEAARESDAEVQMGNGETYDFEFAPERAGELRFEVVAGNGSRLAAMAIHVR